MTKLLDDYKVAVNKLLDDYKVAVKTHDILGDDESLNKLNSIRAAIENITITCHDFLHIKMNLEEDIRYDEEYGTLYIENIPDTDDNFKKLKQQIIQWQKKAEKYDKAMNPTCIDSPLLRTRMYELQETNKNLEKELSEIKAKYDRLKECINYWSVNPIEQMELINEIKGILDGGEK